MKNILRTRKTKSILRSVVIMAAVLVFSLSAIALIDRIEQKYALKADLSFNRITTYGSITEEVLQNLQHSVHVYALFTPGEEDHHLINLLERYQAGSKFFTFSVEDIAKNPMLIHSISDSLQDNAVSPDSLIVYCKEKDRTRVLDASNYISSTYDPETGSFAATGATYENSITEAIAYVTSDQLPLIQMLSGHNELGKEETSSLLKLLTSRNYEVTQINLLKDSISTNGLLMILSPRKDLTDIELSAIMEYTSKGGALFITSDYSNPHDLPNFNALLRLYGISILPGIVVAKEEEKASYYDSPLYLMPYMQDSEITTPLIASGQDRLMLAGARAFSMPSAAQADLQVTSLLKSGKAYLRAFDENNIILQQQEGDPEGIFDLALYSDRADIQGTHSRAFVIGNSSVFTDEWLYQNTYSTEFLMQVIQTIYTQHPTDISIQPKVAFRPSLGFGSMALPATIIAALPLLVLVIALLVLTPRKRR